MDQACWIRCKKALLEQLGEEDSVWIEPLQLEKLSPDEVVLSGIPNPFFQKRIASHFITLLAFALRAYFPHISFNKQPRFVLQIAPLEPTIHPTPEASDISPASYQKTVSAISSVSIQENPLSEVIPHSGIAKGLRLANKTIEEPGSWNPLLFTGAPAVGKTRLLQGIAHSLKQQGLQVLFISGEDWKQMVLRAIQARQGLAMHKHLQSFEALLLDGLEELVVSRRSQDVLQHLLDRLKDQQAPVVISCQNPPSALPLLSPSLMSRLEMGLLCELYPPSPLEAQSLVEHWADQHNLQLTNESIHWLAEQFADSPRRLQGGIARLAAYNQSNQQLPSLAQLQQLLAPLLTVQQYPPISPTQILTMVNKAFYLEQRMLSSRQRTQQVATARSVAIHLLKQQRLSYQDIGRMLGGRTAASILKNHQRFKKNLPQEPHLKKILYSLQNSLRTEAPSNIISKKKK